LCRGRDKKNLIAISLRGCDENRRGGCLAINPASGALC
jgi:hypothetical protein